MSYNDSYGGEPRRSSRRVAREPAGSAKVQGSTAAAILVFIAIIGFGLGAIIANAGGGEDPATTENDPNQAGNPSAPADDTTDLPDDSPTEDSSGEDGGDEQPAGGDGITLTSLQDGGEVGDDSDTGTIGVQAVLDSGEDGVTLSLERSLDNGQWEPFCENCTKETSGGGTFASSFWSGRTGENQFRVVGPDGLVSNAIIVNVVEVSDDDDDNSGPGNGNGTGGG